ncbi:hypothetical protein [Nocardia sp. NPDC057272]|uniref:hypothetical protein n=1 Tax=Nocardia sp. NPDC057272 TaxID=3346079 RepID=UPI00362EF506
MTAAFFAALAGLVGVMIGRLWDIRSESTRWRRDQKTASYQRVIEQFQVTYEAIRVVALTDTDAAAFQALIEHTRSGGFAAWDSAVAAVWLHGSTDVVVAVTDLDEALGALFSAATDRQIQDRAEWDQARQPAGAVFEQFVNAARRELDLPPAPVRVFHSAQILPTTGHDSAAITEQRRGS